MDQESRLDSVPHLTCTRVDFSETAEVIEAHSFPMKLPLSCARATRNDEA